MKCLCKKLAKELNWYHHINYLATKLNRANSFFNKEMKKYVNKKILRSIYFGVFDSRRKYGNLICSQNCNLIQPIAIL